MPIELDLQAAWRDAILGPDGRPHGGGRMILAELSHYCDGENTTARYDGNGRMDPIASAMREGRRQVYLHITALIFRERVPDDTPRRVSPVDDVS